MWSWREGMAGEQAHTRIFGIDDLDQRAGISRRTSRWSW